MAQSFHQHQDHLQNSFIILIRLDALLELGSPQTGHRSLTIVSRNSPPDGGYFVEAEKKSAAAPLEKTDLDCTSQHYLPCSLLNSLCLYYLQVQAGEHSISVQKTRTNNNDSASSAVKSVISVPIKTLFEKKGLQVFITIGMLCFWIAAPPFLTPIICQYAW